MHYGPEDYITVKPHRSADEGPDRYNVVIMTYDERSDEYSISKISEPVNHKASEALALSWSAATGLEIR